MKASSKHPRVEPSTSDAYRPPTSGDLIAKDYLDTTATVDPPPSSSSDSSLRSMLDIVMIVQAAHGQIMLDVLLELQALWVDLAGVRGSTLLAPPFDDDSWLPFGNSLQKGAVHTHGAMGRLEFIDCI